MPFFFVRILIMLLVTGAAVAADPWQKELAGPLVKVEAGQMIFEEYELCATQADAETGETQTFQVKTRGEAPAGAFISRDYFVALREQEQSHRPERNGNQALARTLR